MPNIQNNLFAGGLSAAQVDHAVDLAPDKRNQYTAVKISIRVAVVLKITKQNTVITCAEALEQLIRIGL